MSKISLNLNKYEFFLCVYFFTKTHYCCINHSQPLRKISSVIYNAALVSNNNGKDDFDNLKFCIVITICMVHKAITRNKPTMHLIKILGLSFFPEGLISNPRPYYTLHYHELMNILD